MTQLQYINNDPGTPSFSTELCFLMVSSLKVIRQYQKMATIFLTKTFTVHKERTRGRTRGTSQLSLVTLLGFSQILAINFYPYLGNPNCDMLKKKKKLSTHGCPFLQKKKKKKKIREHDSSVVHITIPTKS